MSSKRVCVLGLGYVGLPIASMLASSGHKVRGVDVSRHVVDTLTSGKLPIEEPGLRTVVTAALASGNLQVEMTPTAADVFLICVPTPTREDHSADLSYIEAAARSIEPLLEDGNLVVLESTSPPGTTREVLYPALIGRGAPGRVLHVAHCPERILPGSTLEELIHNDRVIGGLTSKAAELAQELYASFCQGKMLLTDADTAEMVKIMENTFRDVNIALANEFARICEQAGIDVWQAIECANHHPRVSILQPGPGVGGHCIPVDPWFLVEKFPDQTPLVRTARNVNDSVPLRLAERVAAAIAVEDPKVCVLGVAYKRDIDDARETPAWPFVQRLESLGVAAQCYDPHVRSWRGELCNNLTDALFGADALVVMTDHRDFRAIDPQFAAEVMRGRILFDPRRALDQNKWKAAGFGVGPGEAELRQGRGAVCLPAAQASAVRG